MRAFAKRQPKPGDIVLMCPHVNDGTYHWVYFEGGAIRMPAGTIHTVHLPDARWISLCNKCYVSHDDPIDAVDHHIVWSDREPVIRESKQ